MASRENRVPIMLSEEEVEAIDEWASRNGIATRSAAIRRLCQVAVGIESDFDVAMDRSQELMENFADTLKVTSQDIGDLRKQGRENEALTLEAAYANIVDLFDEFVFVHYHWLEMNNVVQTTVQAKSVVQARKESARIRDELFAFREKLIENRKQLLGRRDPGPKSKGD